MSRTRVRLWAAALALLLISAAAGLVVASLHFGRTAAQPPTGRPAADRSASLPPTTMPAEDQPPAEGGTEGSESGPAGNRGAGGLPPGTAGEPLPPLPKGEGKLAIIIDDMGQGLPGTAELLTIDRPLTFSFLPHTPFLRREVAEVTAQGQQVLLHVPMEPKPESGVSPGPDAVTTQMTDEQVEALLQSLVRELPEARGVNNHMGSLATADHRLMTAVMRTLKSLNLPFVDSRTYSASVAFETAQEMGLPAATNSLFIDRERTVSAVEARLRQAALIAQRHGSAIVIGHPHPAVARAIQEMAPALEAAGVRMVFVTELLN